MKVTKQMLDAALRKAVEAGLLPRSLLREESFADREVIRLILEAAIDVADEPRHNTVCKNIFPSWRRFARQSFSVNPHMPSPTPCAKRG